MADGGPSPGQIHNIPSFSKHGNDLIFTLCNRVDGIFSHVPSVEYSHPEIHPSQRCQTVIPIIVRKHWNITHKMSIVVLHDLDAMPF